MVCNKKNACHRREENIISGITAVQSNMMSKFN